ncbi:MAG: glycosyltransferase family 4 protein [Planctomycetes bacterium]|nr:glycosyltransferase family 4 protein [Planctomycetota bacterium]
MRILHIFGDHKWTGPAEPTVNLCLALRARGHEVWFASRKAGPGEVAALDDRAKQRGLEPLHLFSLNKWVNFRDNWADTRKIRKFLEEAKVEVLHVHGSHDHFLGGWAARRARNRPVIVRTFHKGTAYEPGLGSKVLMRLYVDGWISYTPEGLAEDVTNFGLAPERTLAVEGAVDLERFDPARARPCREALGLPAEAVVAGIVARMQRHRRFGELMEAVKIALGKAPQLRLLAVGRGTHREAVAVEPAKKLGIADKVVFAGYRGGDFKDVLASIDFKVFLVPGSDGSCRAVREAMAMGKPVVAARRGLLPELVRDGETGLLVDDTPENLAEALVRMATDAPLRERLGRAAREDALRRFSPDTQAAAIEAFYKRVAALGPAR